MTIAYQRNIKESLLGLCNEIKDRPELIELYDEHYPNTHWVKIIDFKVLYENNDFRANYLDTYVKLRLIEQHLLKLVNMRGQDINSTSLISSIDGEPLSGLTFKYHSLNYKESEFRARIKHYQELINEAEQQIVAMHSENYVNKEHHGFWNLASTESEHKTYKLDEVLLHIDTFSVSRLARFRAQLSVMEAINKVKESIADTTEDTAIFCYRITSDSIVTLYVNSSKINPIVEAIFPYTAIDLYVNNDPKDSAYGYQYHVGIIEPRFISKT